MWIQTLGGLSTVWQRVKFLADPGDARGCSTNSLVIHWLIHWVSEPLPHTALQRCHSQTVRDSTSSYKIDYVIVIKNFLNPEGHQNPISGLKVTAILLKGWNLPIGVALLGRVCVCSLRRRLVLKLISFILGSLWYSFLHGTKWLFRSIVTAHRTTEHCNCQDINLEP